MEKVVCILGSSRSDGDTARVVRKLKELSGCSIIDLNKYSISYYDYRHLNKTDDFIPLIRTIVNEYTTIIFATPVYWYTMSGIMKVFFDRFTDILTIEKELGRALRGKKVGVISCSINSNIDEVFWHPFVKTAGYLGMNYIGNIHIHTHDNDTLLQEFIRDVIRL